MCKANFPKFVCVPQGSLDNVNLFSLITILSFFLLLPVALAVDGVRFTPAAMSAMGIADPSLVIKQSMLAAVCFHGYQQVCAGCFDLHACISYSFIVDGALASLC